MKINNSCIPECVELKPGVFKDKRGILVKTFQADAFKKFGLETNFVEEFYSVSRNRVLRGLHFQLPPVQVTKLIFCVFGKALDVVLDLRIGSPAYGKYALFELSSQEANIIYIPAGLAHGFYALSAKVIMIYKTTKIYSPKYDSGILWNSVKIPWPDKKPIISERDSKFLPFSQFVSPFTYNKP
jgi:dTDP-4-dehydrorhamnose 3,5-epimerase